MCIKHIFTGILICFLTKIHAQKVIYEGIVKDSLQTLSFTNIIANPLDSTTTMVFSISDERGHYKLNLKKNHQYELSATFMGYSRKVDTITALKDTNYNFNLKESTNKLEEVVIELPVVKKEDLIIYDVDKFTTGKERKLKNVLKKLPGVDVDRNNNVTVQGKKVTKVLVDGKLFFGGNSKLAIENIPADAIDKIEAIDNFTEISVLKGVKDSDKLAMNIKLKKDKNKFVFGNIEAGKGNKKFYKANAKLFYYSPKTKVNFIGNLNNINERSLTFKDYMNFNGGREALMTGQLDFINQGLFGKFIKRKDFTASDQQFGAFNIHRQIHRNWDLSGYSIFSNSATKDSQITQNSYPFFTENLTQNGEDKEKISINQIQLKYKIDKIEEWIFKTQFNKNNSNGLNLIQTAVTKNVNHVQTDTKEHVENINQYISYHRKLSKEHTISSSIQYSYSKETPFSQWKSNQGFLIKLLPKTTQETIYSQEKLKKHHYLNVAFEHYYNLNRLNRIYTSFGFSFKDEVFSSTSTELKNNIINSLYIFGFDNQIGFKLKDFYFGLHHKFKLGTSEFKYGAVLHQLHWAFANKNFDNSEKLIVLPEFYWKHKFRGAGELRLKYNLKSNFQESNQLANRFYLQSYNSIFKGNSELRYQLYHQANLRYNFFSLYEGLIASAYLNYTKKPKGITSLLVFEEQNYYSTLKELTDLSENLNYYISISKKKANIKYQLKLSHNYADFKQKVNKKTQRNYKNTYSYDFSTKISSKKLPYITLGFNQLYSGYKTKISRINFVNSELYSDFGYSFLENFNLDFNYSYNIAHNKTQKHKNTYQIANISLQYLKDSNPWGFVLSVNNIFDTKFKQLNSFTTIKIMDRKNLVMPLTAVLSIYYKL